MINSRRNFLYNADFTLCSPSIPIWKNGKLNCSNGGFSFWVQPCVIGVFPGYNLDFARKAIADPNVNCLLFDNQDAVGAADKEKGRQGILENLRHLGRIQKIITMRINGINSSEYGKDIVVAKLLADEKLIDAVYLPDVDSPTDIKKLRTDLGERNVLLLPNIETAQGLENAHQIMLADPSIAGLTLGQGDMIGSLKMYIPRENPEQQNRLLAPVKHRIVSAARAGGGYAFDTPEFVIPSKNATDSSSIREKYLTIKTFARDQGMNGCWSIHPSQAEMARPIFGFDKAAYDESWRLLNLFFDNGAKAIRDEVTSRMLDTAVVLTEANRIITGVGIRALSLDEVLRIENRSLQVTGENWVHELGI